MRSASVIAREPHGLHHRFGARHMKGNLVQPGYSAQHLRIFDDGRVITTEHRPEFAHPCSAPLDRTLVKIVAEQVDAVRASEVVTGIAVEISEGHAMRRRDEACRRQMCPHQVSILERHAIGSGKLQVRQRLRRRGGASNGLGEPQPVNLRKLFKGRASPLRDVTRRAIGAEKSLRAVFIKRHEAGQAAGDARMAGERRMLGLRQFEPLAQGRDRSCYCRGADSIESESRRTPLHRVAV